MMYGNPFDQIKAKKEGKYLNVIQGDIRNEDLVDGLMYGIDAVIHLACISNDPSFDLNPELGASINLDAFEPLVDMAREAKVKRFINASSSSVYGIKDEPNVTEDMSLNPLTDYSKYKKETELILRKYCNHDFTTVSIRSATVCGYSRRQRLDVIVNILTNFAYFKNKIYIHGGDQKRPNIHIDDITDLYSNLLIVNKNLINGDVFNFGSTNYTIKELAYMVKECVEPSVGKEIEIIQEESNDNRSYHISSDKIKYKLNMVPKKTIREAIYDLVYAFRTEKLTNTFEDDKYYNIQTMKNINLE